MSLSDSVAVVTLILTIAGLVIGIVIGWYSSEGFRAVVQRLTTIFWVKFVKQRPFRTVYIPALLSAFVILYFLDRLTITAGILVYALWVTGWSYHLYRRRRNIAQIASVMLGWPESEDGSNGIEHVFYSDGITRTVPFDNQVVRCTHVKEGQYYMYFKFRDDVVRSFRVAPSVLLGVEYYDFGEPEFHNHAFDLSYDSTDRTHPRPDFKHTQPITFDNTGRWALKIVEIRDGRFARSQQGIADFRINCQLRPASHKVLHDLYVRRVVAIALNE